MSLKFTSKNTLSRIFSRLSEIFVKKNDIVDNVTSTDTNKPLSANQGKVLNESISTLNSNMIPHQKWYISAGETRRVLVRDPYGDGNLVIFSTYFVIPSYKSIFFASSGNGNNTNSGQNITITKLLESSVVTVSLVNEKGSYNCFDITNNGEYAIYLHANTLYGRQPDMY